MNKFFIIASYNFKDIVSRSFFKISTLIISFLIIFVVFLPDLIMKFDFVSKTNKEYLFYIIDKNKLIFDDDLDINLYSKDLDSYLDNSYYFKYIDENLDEGTLNKKINLGEIDGYILIKDNRNIEILTSENFPEIKFILDRYILSKDKNKNITYPVYDINSLDLVKNNIKDIISRYTFPLILMMFMYSIYILYGQFMSLSINMEKSSKIIDIFLTKTNLPTIILGKLFGVLVAGLIQIFYFLSLLFLTVFLMKEESFPLIKDIISFDLAFILKYILYFIFGFIIYGLLFIIVGISIDKVEDLSIGIIPVIFVISFAYFCAIINLQFPNNYLHDLLIYIPFLSPIVFVTNSEILFVKELIVISTMFIFVVLLVILNINVFRKMIKFK